MDYFHWFVFICLFAASATVFIVAKLLILDGQLREMELSNFFNLPATQQFSRPSNTVDSVIR